MLQFSMLPFLFLLQMIHEHAAWQPPLFDSYCLYFYFPTVHHMFSMRFSFLLLFHSMHRLHTLSMPLPHVLYFFYI